MIYSSTLFHPLKQTNMLRPCGCISLQILQFYNKMASFSIPALYQEGKPSLMIRCSVDMPSLLKNKQLIINDKLPQILVAV